MPVDIVDVTIETATASPTRPTYNDVLLIGSAQTAPTPGFNTPQQYSDPTEVATDFGDGSDVHVSSQVLDQMGVDRWLVVVLEETTTTEVIGGSDTASTSSGTVTNTPIAGAGDVAITVDGTETTEVAVTADPPDSDGEPGTDEAYYNPDTGDVVTGTASSGTGAGIEVTYSNLSWADAKVPMESAGTDVAILADVHAGVDYLGTLDELISWGVTADAAVLAAGPDGRDFADDLTAMQTYHEIGAYLPSGNFALFAHKSSDDAAAYLAGQAGTERAWHDVMYYSGGYPGLTSESYRTGLVGEPGQDGTFEGGDTDGAGPVNVLINVQGQLVASNSVTTAGASSSYPYLDIWRTERFAVSEAELALVGLSLRVDDIPFNQDGHVLIVDALEDRLASHVGSRQPFTELEIDVPTRAELSDQHISDRIWGPITIEGTLTGNAHQFEVQFAASV